MEPKRDTTRLIRLARLAPLGFLYGVALLLVSVLTENTAGIHYSAFQGPTVYLMNRVGLAFLFGVFALITWDVTRNAKI